MGRRLAVIGSALLWLVSVVAAATLGIYSAVPTPGDFYQGQDEDLETAPFQPNWSPPYDKLLDDGAYWGKGLLLFKLMKSLQQGLPSGDESPYYKSEYDYTDSSWPDALDFKENDVKRWVTSLNNSASSKASKAETARLQRKWKIKKGKGIPSLCYFKLCSFRRYR
ncbi:uncharacterized protein LOC123872263 [Maniola jurtina]|uniref:uncharacterized protein LOC123872263 n=1 Tax=Maniola jurtina TaxID=191418 RepID=UPI001E68BE3F|nr:uncharacterized protein LOC123872263 [Maniola jurtina]